VTIGGPISGADVFMSLEINELNFNANYFNSVAEDKMLTAF
jgi:hypothetical protein